MEEKAADVCLSDICCGIYKQEYESVGYFSPGKPQLKGRDSVESSIGGNTSGLFRSSSLSHERRTELGAY